MLGGLETVWQAIVNLPQLISDKLSGFFEDIESAITGLPDRVANLIKEIFIPDTEYINNAFDSFLEEMKMKFSFDTEFFESILSTEGHPVTDVNSDYDIPGVGTLNLKFFDTKYLVQGVDYFRPFIRGFLVLLMALYNIKMIIGFFRQDAGVITGKAVDMEMGGKKK